MKKDYFFAKVYQPLNITARLKQHADDFVVEEQIPVKFSNDGEHCWIYVKKSGCNTDWLAQQLAKYCGVKKMAVAYAGLKDRHAVTSQWFSVQLPGKPTPDWRKFETSFANHVAKEAEATGNRCSQKVEVIQSFRHNRKLQRGALKSNSFKITLRELSNTSDESFELLNQRCALIAENGVPNYFGGQRFGSHRFGRNNNLDQAIKLFTKPGIRIARHKRSIYLSAARSWLFNCILSERIQRNLWDRRLSGDVFMLDGRSACFKDDKESEDDRSLEERLAQHEIHPTAALWGEGDVMVCLQAAELEKQVIDKFPVYRDGLVAARVQAQRRACRVIPERMACTRKGNDLTVSFTLPAGSYATMVLAEVFTELIESE